jgi:CRP-like cAMP-binding protein
MPNTYLPPFQLDVAICEQLRSLKETEFAAQGTFLFQRGDEPNGAFLLLRGKVALSTGDHTAKLRRSCLPGCLLGLPATVRNRPYSLTAECLEDCEYVQVSHADLISLLESNRRFCMHVVEVLAHEVGELRSRMPEEASRFSQLQEQMVQRGSL